MKIGADKWRSALDLLENFEQRLEGAGFGLIAPEAADYANTLHLKPCRDTKTRWIALLWLRQGHGG